MQRVNPSRWPLILVLYALPGAALALDPGPARWLGELVVRQGWKPGIGIFISINLIMPLCAVFLAAIYPRFRTALAGGFLLMAAFVLARLLSVSPRFWGWNAAFILNHTSPIEVAGMFGYMAIGSLFVAITKPWRRVARADEHLRCEQCGYLLPGAPGPACPECNTLFDPERIRARHT